MKYTESCLHLQIVYTWAIGLWQKNTLNVNISCIFKFSLSPSLSLSLSHTHTHTHTHTQTERERESVACRAKHIFPMFIKVFQVSIKQLLIEVVDRSFDTLPRICLHCPVPSHKKLQVTSLKKSLCWSYYQKQLLWDSKGFRYKVNWNISIRDWNKGIWIPHILIYWKAWLGDHFCCFK